jgi:hypothetical protein
VSQTTLCPNGHQSQDPEWCDTCGARLGAAPAPVPTGQPPDSSAAPARPATPTTPAIDCPHCGTPNEAGALFCEGCGYDFTTGQAPPSTEPTGAVEASEPPPAPAAQGWVVVVEVDPAWYELKGQLADHPCPPVSSSTIALTASTALIGRTSQSKQLHPEIALDGDTGVSRRHAQLVCAADGSWTVVDLGSSNGTYVVPAGEAPSHDVEALPVGIPRALADRDAIYLGAWTKLTVRGPGG